MSFFVKWTTACGCLIGTAEVIISHKALLIKRRRVHANGTRTMTSATFIMHDSNESWTLLLMKVLRSFTKASLESQQFIWITAKHSRVGWKHPRAGLSNHYKSIRNNEKKIKKIRRLSWNFLLASTQAGICFYFCDIKQQLCLSLIRLHAWQNQYHEHRHQRLTDNQSYDQNLIDSHLIAQAYRWPIEKSGSHDEKSVRAENIKIQFIIMRWYFLLRNGSNSPQLLIKNHRLQPSDTGWKLFSNFPFKSGFKNIISPRRTLRRASRANWLADECRLYGKFIFPPVEDPKKSKFPGSEWKKNNNEMENLPLGWMCLKRRRRRAVKGWLKCVYLKINRRALKVHSE